MCAISDLLIHSLYKSVMVLDKSASVVTVPEIMWRELFDPDHNLFNLIHVLSEYLLISMAANAQIDYKKSLFCALKIRLFPIAI